MQKDFGEYIKQQPNLQDMMSNMDPSQMPKDFDPSKFQEMFKNMTPEQMEEITKQMGGMMSTPTDDSIPELDEEPESDSDEKQKSSPSEQLTSC